MSAQPTPLLISSSSWTRDLKSQEYSEHQAASVLLVPDVCNAPGNDQQLIQEGRGNMLPLVCVRTVMHSTNPCSALMQK